MVKFSCIKYILSLVALFITVSNSGTEKDESGKRSCSKEIKDAHGAVTRRNPARKTVYLVFTADEFAEGREKILITLNNQKIKSSFFLTGNFLRNPDNRYFIQQAVRAGHYIGPHSDRHLLYADWSNRDSLLVSKKEFENDLHNNYEELKKFGISFRRARFFIPPYEWYNRNIVVWSASLGIQVVNLTPGTGTNADYTTPDMPNYQSSESLLQKFFRFESANPNGLNGCIVLIHLGTDPLRKDKFYLHLDNIISDLKGKGYSFNKF